MKDGQQFIADASQALTEAWAEIAQAKKEFDQRMQRALVKLNSVQARLSALAAIAKIEESPTPTQILERLQ